MPPKQKITDEESLLMASNSGQGSTSLNGGGSEMGKKIREQRARYESLVSGSMKELLYKDGDNSILNFATLQRMILFRLQERIIEKVGKLDRFSDPAFDEKHPLDSLKEDLAEYSKNPEKL